jgi:hypothetical protein
MNDQPFSPEAAARYLARHGNLCPNCGSVLIEAGEVIAPYNGKFCQDVRCHACERIWMDIYTLARVEPKSLEKSCFVFESPYIPGNNPES